MSDPSARRDPADRAVDAHDRLVVALYGGEMELLDGGRVVTNAWIDEPEWNHAGAIALPEDDLESRLEPLCARLLERRRKPVLVVDPLCRPLDLASRLTRGGWSECFRHAGLLFPRELPDPPVRWPAGSTIEEFGTSNFSPPIGESGPAGLPLAEFGRVFHESFAETAGGDLSPAYGQAFAAALSRPQSGVEVVHTLVRVGGEPAAVASRASVAGVAGLYNLGVSPAFRRLGLGGALTLHRVVAARASGSEVVYLLTEDARVEAAQRRRGFVRSFELIGLAAPGSDRLA